MSEARVDGFLWSWEHIDSRLFLFYYFFVCGYEISFKVILLLSRFTRRGVNYWLYCLLFLLLCLGYFHNWHLDINSLSRGFRRKTNFKWVLNIICCLNLIFFLSIFFCWGFKKICLDFYLFDWFEPSFSRLSIRRHVIAFRELFNENFLGGVQSME